MMLPIHVAARKQAPSGAMGTGRTARAGPKKTNRIASTASRYARDPSTRHDPNQRPAPRRGWETIQSAGPDIADAPQEIQDCLAERLEGPEAGELDRLRDQVAALLQQE